ncbi:MAG: hypothetical protein ACPGR7_02845 [Flavobacteriaceae bacterium]
MTRKLLSLLIILSLGLSAHAQKEQFQLVSSKDLPAFEQSQELLLTYEAFNRYFNKQASFYLTSKADMNLFKVQFSVDTGNNSFNLGYQGSNIDKDKDKNLSFSYALNLKGSLSDDLSTIYKNGDFQEGFGLNPKLNFFFGKSITYLKKDKDNFKVELEKFEKLQNAQLIVDRANYEEVLAQIDDEGLKNELREKHDKKLLAAKKEAFTEKQLELLPKTIKGSHMFWTGLEVFIPFSKTTYTVLEDLSNQSGEAFTTYPLSGGLSLNYIYQNASKIGVLMSLEGAAQNSNNIFTKEITSATREEQLVVNTDPYLVQIIKSESLYVGNFENLLLTSLKGEVMLVKKFKSYVQSAGLRASMEKYFGDFDPLNLELGLPFTLATSNQKNAPISLELQFILNDLDQSKSINELYNSDLIVGVKASIPFGNLKY